MRRHRSRTAGACGPLAGLAAPAAAARGSGTATRTDCPVEQIVVEHGRATGVRLESGRRLRARHVVSNTDPKRTFLRLLGADALPADFRRQVQNLKTRAGYMKY